jgi:hypothetical protein
MNNKNTSEKEKDANWVTCFSMCEDTNQGILKLTGVRRIPAVEGWPKMDAAFVAKLIPFESNMPITQWGGEEAATVGISEWDADAGSYRLTIYTSDTKCCSWDVWSELLLKTEARIRDEMQTLMYHADKTRMAQLIVEAQDRQGK